MQGDTSFVGGSGAAREVQRHTQRARGRSIYPDSQAFPPARQGMSENKPFGCWAQPRLSGGGDLLFWFDGEGFPLERLSFLAFCYPDSRAFPPRDQ